MTIRARVENELASLGEERSFLLRSLLDLEREHDAGDVVDDDYETLKDDYTVRAADVLRQIDAGKRRLAPKPDRRWGRTIAIGATVVVVAGVIGWMLAQAWGERGVGQEITGFTPGDEVREILTDARSQMFTNLPRANDLFLRAVELEESRGVRNPEPLTYYAWTLALGTLGTPDIEAAAAQREVALLALDRAIRMDRDYADPHCFVGIIRFRFRGEAEAAEPFLTACVDRNPPSEILEWVTPIQAQVNAELVDDELSDRTASN